MLSPCFPLRDAMSTRSPCPVPRESTRAPSACSFPREELTQPRPSRSPQGRHMATPGLRLSFSMGTATHHSLCFP